MGLQRYPLGGFLGGMNLIDNPYALENNEAQKAFNVDLGVRDVLSSRKGYSEGNLSAVIESQTKHAGAGATGAEPGLPVWANPGNIVSSNNAYATITLAPGETSNPLISSSHGFVLPANAIVQGIIISVEISSSRGFQPVERPIISIQLTKGGVAVGKPFFFSPGIVAPNTDVVTSRGNSEFLWSTTLTKAEAEAAGLGATIRVFNEGSVGAELKVDDVFIQLSYAVPGTGTDIVTHMRSWYPGAERQLIASANGKIKQLKGTTLSTLFTGTAATTWDFEAMEYNPGTGLVEELFALNGVDTPRRISAAGTVVEWKGATKKIPPGNMNRVWKNRMVISGVVAFPQRVFFSEIGNPLLPDDETNGGYGNNWIDIKNSEDDTDPVIWIEVLTDVLIIFKKKSVWAVYEEEKFANYKIANVGCEGRFLSCVLDDRCYFANRYGVYSTDAEGNVRYESQNLEPIFKAEGPAEFPNLDLKRLGTEGRMVALPNGRVYLACGPEGGTANKWLFEGYPRLRGSSSARKGADERTPWVIHEFKARRIKAIAIYRSKDEEVDKIVAGLTSEVGTNPELVRLFYSARDGLEPITWEWWSGRKPEVSVEPFERIRRVNVLMKGKVIAQMFSDKEASEEATLESEEESVQEFKPETWGRYHQLKLGETGQVSTSIYTIELVFRGGKEHT